MKRHPYRRASVASVKLTPRHRLCLSAVYGGGATVGASLRDVLATVGQRDRTLTEREAVVILNDLEFAHLTELSVVDKTRWVITPKGIEVIEG